MFLLSRQPPESGPLQRDAPAAESRLCRYTGYGYPDSAAGSIAFVIPGPPAACAGKALRLLN